MLTDKEVSFPTVQLPYRKIKLHNKIGQPPTRFRDRLLHFCYWIFPPTMLWGALKHFCQQVVGPIFGRILMRQPVEASITAKIEYQLEQNSQQAQMLAGLIETLQHTSDQLQENIQARQKLVGVREAFEEPEVKDWINLHDKTQDQLNQVNDELEEVRRQKQALSEQYQAMLHEPKERIKYMSEMLEDLLATPTQPDEYDRFDFYPKYFYTKEEAYLQAAIMDAMIYGKENLAYDATATGDNNPYRQAEVQNYQLVLDDGAELDTYAVTYDGGKQQTTKLDVQLAALLQEMEVLCSDQEQSMTTRKQQLSALTQRYRNVLREKLEINGDRKAFLYFGGRGRDARSELARAVHNAVFYSDPSKIFGQEWRQYFKKLYSPTVDILTHYTPYESATHVVFNYRGVGTSKKQATQDQDVIDDGIAQITYMLSEGYQFKNIYLKCHSMGGLGMISAAQFIKTYRARIDDFAFQEFLLALHGRADLYPDFQTSREEMVKYIADMKLNGLVIRGAATRTFGDLPYTIACKLAVGLREKGKTLLASIVTGLTWPVLAITAALTNFRFHVLSGYEYLRDLTAQHGHALVANKRLVARHVNAAKDTNYCGDTVISEDAQLGSRLRKRFLAKLQRLDNKFSKCASGLQVRDYATYDNFVVSEMLADVQELLDYADDNEKSLDVCEEVTNDTVRSLHDKAPERILIKDKTFHHEHWFFMQYVPDADLTTTLIREKQVYAESRISAGQEPELPKHAQPMETLFRQLGKLADYVGPLHESQALRFEFYKTNPRAAFHILHEDNGHQCEHSAAACDREIEVDYQIHSVEREAKKRCIP